MQFTSSQTELTNQSHPLTFGAKHRAGSRRGRLCIYRVTGGHQPRTSFARVPAEGRRKGGGWRGQLAAARRTACKLQKQWKKKRLGSGILRSGGGRARGQRPGSDRRDGGVSWSLRGLRGVWSAAPARPRRPPGHSRRAHPRPRGWGWGRTFFRTAAPSCGGGSTARPTVCPPACPPATPCPRRRGGGVRCLVSALHIFTGTPVDGPFAWAGANGIARTPPPALRHVAHTGPKRARCAAGRLRATTPPPLARSAPTRPHPPRTGVRSEDSRAPFSSAQPRSCPPPLPAARAQTVAAVSPTRPSALAPTPTGGRVPPSHAANVPSLVRNAHCESPRAAPRFLSTCCRCGSVWPYPRPAFLSCAPRGPFAARVRSHVGRGRRRCDNRGGGGGPRGPCGGDAAGAGEEEGQGVGWAGSGRRTGRERVCIGVFSVRCGRCQ